jgi:anti-sigma regulatory factor (Ser/Thr protein kinase)
MRTTAGADVHEHAKTTTFPRQIQVAPTARQFVRQAAAGHPAADDAVLLAAELIANSLAHALDATTVTITVAVSEAFIRVDVRDDGALGIPHMRPGDPEAEDGRGLRLINQIARRWGFTREPAGSCCWAEIASPAT